MDLSLKSRIVDRCNLSQARMAAAVRAEPVAWLGRVTEEALACMAARSDEWRGPWHEACSLELARRAALEA